MDVWAMMDKLDNIGAVSFVYNDVAFNANDRLRDLGYVKMDLGDRLIPEPTSLALLGLGAMGLLARRRSR